MIGHSKKNREKLYEKVLLIKKKKAGLKFKAGLALEPAFEQHTLSTRLKCMSYFECFSVTVHVPRTMIESNLLVSLA